MPQAQQPFLHDLRAQIAAPTQVWSRDDGEIVPGSSMQGAGQGGGQGVLHADVRMLSELTLRVDGRPAEHIATGLGLEETTFTYLLRHLEGLRTADPALRLDRVRRIHPGEVSETLAFSSVLDSPATFELTLRFAADLVPIEAVKVGAADVPQPLTGTPDGAAWSDRSGEVAARLSADAAVVTAAADAVSLSWELTVPVRGELSVGWRLQLGDSGGVVRAAPTVPAATDWVERALALAGPTAARDHRLRPWAERTFADLAGLTMSTVADPADAFFAAGAPWYFTLFGRDSILAAQLMLPVDLAPAIETLRTLARLQGSRVDVESAEQPGKIIHELRRGTFAFGDVALSARYYGTVDATPLFVCLLHDVWSAGLDLETVRELLPALEGALRWITEYAPAEDGFLAYLDPTGRGLSNQGWKDSSDSVRFADGSIAEGPIALCEVQGYAHEAALGGAALLAALGEPGGEALRSWAGELADRFRQRFWCERDGLRFPALALDGGGRRVDSVTSNIGHLIGTGLLSGPEERLVADLVSGPELDSGLGLRTLAADEAAYAPLSYHCGSVWPHDTAVVIARLRRAGLHDQARGLAEGLVRASVAFDGRLPELWSGEGRPVPYPMACRPQAWSAAAIVPVLQILGE